MLLGGPQKQCLLFCHLTGIKESRHVIPIRRRVLWGAQLEPASNSLEAIERETGDQYVDIFWCPAYQRVEGMVLGDGLFTGRLGIHFSESVEAGGERLGSTSNASSESFFDCHFPKCPSPLGTSNVFLFLISRKPCLERQMGVQGKLYEGVFNYMRAVKQSSHKCVCITHTYSHTLWEWDGGQTLDILGPVSTSTLPLCYSTPLGPVYPPPFLCMFSLLGNHFSAMCFRFFYYKIEILVSP